MGFDSDWQLRELSKLSQLVGDVSGLQLARGAPYVGRAAFAHKGGRTGHKRCGASRFAVVCSRPSGSTRKSSSALKLSPRSQPLRQ